ncbi:uncharacterized protein V1518DRAFT_215996 [Limtongia smithiae]|uniref:uncharacterized protein n=1 Tax=Limtongia smithiae TaxID=1125753 RepID=UPI0034CE2C27
MISLRKLVRPVLALLVLAALGLNAYTALYPSLSEPLCSWPSGARDSDPVPSPNDLTFLLFADPQIRGTGPNTSYRTKLDIFGNDYFLGYLYTTLVRRLRPTNIVVLGDLFSSQWISDGEFENRTKRYASRIFTSRALERNGGGELWNVSGNHDIGYAHDVTTARVSRFRKNFGALNFAVYGQGFRAIVFNSMVVDSEDVRQARDTREFLQEQMDVEFSGSTFIFTHVPLYKDAGVCIDSPYFSYYDADKTQIREQNMLSRETSTWILSGFFGALGTSGVVVNGHDHEGCLVEHVREGRQSGDDGAVWRARGIAAGKTEYSCSRRLDVAARVADHIAGAGVLEITVRSMMGQYGGNAGLLSVAWDEKLEGYSRVVFTLCTFGPQHTWWAARVAAIVALAAVTLYSAAVSTVSSVQRQRAINNQQRQRQRR